MGRDKDPKARTDSCCTVHRCRLDDPGAAELVWNTELVSDDSFQVSADGRHAGGLFPYPDAGVADLTTGSWERLGRGCCSAFSPSDDDMFWFFDGLHRDLNLVDMETDRR